MSLNLKDQINIHKQKSEWEEVISLGNQILETDPGDLSALRFMAEAYDNLGQQEDLIEVWRILVDRHHEVAAYSAPLGVALKKEGSDRARGYLEQALVSAIDRRNLDLVEEVWLELAELPNIPSSIFLENAKRLASRKERDLAAELLSLYLDTADVDPVSHLDATKMIIEFSPDRAEGIRHALIEAYQRCYSDRPDIERLIGLSSITSTEDLSEAIVLLDQFLKFGEGQFFYHHGWGAGQVTRIEPTQSRVFIDFTKKKNHVLTLEMADKSLTPIPNDDIRAILLSDPDRAMEMMDSDAVGLVKAGLVALNKKATGKEVKELLLNAPVPEKSWQKWWTAVNKKLRMDPYIEVVGTSMKTYTLREEPEGPDEEFSRRFRAIRTLRGKLDTINQYLDQQGDKASEATLQAMADDLVSKASNSKAENEIVEAFFVISALSDKVKVNEDQLTRIIAPILVDLDRSVNALEGLKSVQLQTRWFEMMEQSLKNELANAYERLMIDGPDSIRDLVAKHVHETHEEDVFSRLFKKYRHNPREQAGLFIWCAKRLLAERELAEAEGTTRPTIVDQLIGLHEVLGYQTKTSKKEDSAELRAHMSLIRQILKRGNLRVLREILTETDTSSARSLWRTIETANIIEDRIRKEVHGYIIAHFPDVVSGGGDEGEAAEGPAAPMPTRLLCLESTLRRQKERLKKLKEVEIPKNTEEIETARQHGDLKENAEYHAAKEKQGVLHALTAQLTQEIANASAIPVGDFAEDQVGYGSLVEIAQDGRPRSITILGPWESDPDRQILSYESPLGKVLWGREVGDRFLFQAGEANSEIEILSLSPLKEAPSFEVAEGINV
ncbi:MAG: GreA/GreB family elongation factor [Candidatus Omnitrophica bacterium]|nr:GreA/GreB family elongation factor [Candidatus Omnitrophota bacterium]